MTFLETSHDGYASFQLVVIRPEGTYSGEPRERAKRKSDAVHVHFYRLRYLVAMRVNQIGKLYRAVKESIALVEAGTPAEASATGSRQPTAKSPPRST